MVWFQIIHKITFFCEKIKTIIYHYLISRETSHLFKSTLIDNLSI